MNTKLTLRMDDSLIEQVKIEAKKRGLSLSKLVSEYFELFVKESTSKTPLTSKLDGILKDITLDESDYKHHLEEKYLCKSAQLIGVDAIITRNEKNFKKVLLAIYSPTALLLFGINPA
jgi:hypothetical protein